MPTEPAHPLHIPRLSVIAVLGCFALFLVLILFFRQSAGVAAKPDLTDVPEGDRWKLTAEGRAAKLADLRTKEQAKLNAYDWIDQGNGVVHLPIERAMELTLQDLNAKR